MLNDTFKKYITGNNSLFQYTLIAKFISTI